MHPRTQHGIALPLALIAIVVAGGLVAGALFAASQELRMAEAVGRLHRALAAAEAGLGEVLGGWRSEYNAAPLYPAGGTTLPDVRSGARVTSTRVVRVSPLLFLLDAATWDSTGNGWGVYQRVALVVRLTPIALDARAALTALGGGRLSGDVRVDGTDRPPPGWPGCGPPDTTRAGLRVNGPLAVADPATAEGEPRWWVDSALGDSAITRYGEVTYEELAARTTTLLGPGEYRPFPPSADDPGIVHVGGDATISGGRGSGILLVDGDLTVGGDFQFFGVVIVRGRLEAAQDGSANVQLWGAVLAGEVALDLAASGGRIGVTYSKCLVESTLRTLARPGPLASRGWRQLF